jgi:hypothetical protein
MNYNERCNRRLPARTAAQDDPGHQAEDVCYESGDNNGNEDPFDAHNAPSCSMSGPLWFAVGAYCSQVFYLDFPVNVCKKR